MKNYKTIKFTDNEGLLLFEDKAQISDGKVISIRDGIMEYYGHEIGHEPANKIFKVYRSPEEVNRIASMIVDIPITDGHIDPTGEVAKNLIHGKVNSFEVIDSEENDIKSTIAVQHNVDLSENMLKYIQDQKPESSLGYTGRLIPHSEFDFEQVGLNPHHLAVVNNGRCGKICTFKDEKVENFLNEDGTLNLEAFLKAIGEVMEKADDSQKGEISKSMMDMFPEMKKEEIQDADAGNPPKKEDDKPSDFKDAAAIKQIATDAVTAFKDSTEFKDAIAKEAGERAETITKAKPFLDEGYKFCDKATVDIMADTLKAEYKDKTFADSEVAVAFKLLDAKAEDSHKAFGDKKPNKWDEAKEKEL